VRTGALCETACAAGIVSESNTVRRAHRRLDPAPVSFPVRFHAGLTGPLRSPSRLILPAVRFLP
jgi:hypothetical protein